MRISPPLCVTQHAAAIFAVRGAAARDLEFWDRVFQPCEHLRLECLYPYAYALEDISLEVAAPRPQAQPLGRTLCFFDPNILAQ
jgi:hypothetical protein